MSEAAKTPDGVEPKPDGSGKKDEFIAKSEVDKIVTDRDEARRRRDEATERARVAETKLADLAREAAEKKAKDEGDIEAFRKISTETIAEKDKALASKDELVKNLVIKSELFPLLAEHSTDPELAFMIIKDLVEVKPNEKGELQVRYKNDTAALKDCVLKTLEKKPLLLKNQRANGVETPQTKEKGKSGITYEQLVAMSPDAFAAAVKKDPELAKIYSRKGK